MKAKRSIGFDPLFWLAAVGGALVVFCGMGTSFGFLMKTLGALALLLAWVLLVCRTCRQSGLSDRQKRRWIIVKIITFTTILTGAILLAAITGLIFSGAKGTPTPDAPTVIVLGAGIRGDQPSATLRSRLDAAYDYLAKHPAAVAILSGGQGDDEHRTEASVMQAYLMRRGVDSARLLTEENARNTMENIRFSRVVMEENELPGPVLVVSNSYHLFRAARLARREGMEAQTLAAPIPYDWLVPPCYLREAGSVILMYLREIF